MITVIGEALLDLVVGHDGHVAARPGGGAFNTARTIGRLGLAPVYAGRLSRDGLGRILRARLDADGVTVGVPRPTDAPTTLAIADVDPAGSASYAFYLAGTSSAALDYPVLSAALPRGLAAVHVGTLALVMEPISSSIDRLIRSGLPPDVLVMVDPNCRPQAITDRQAYMDRLFRILRGSHVVKASIEDLAYLFPGAATDTAAATLLGMGPALVLVTDGARPARGFLPAEQIAVEVPSVQVMDTIGAGDAFGGAFVAWWTRNGLTASDLSRPDPVREALRAAVEVAALTCTRPGAEPPWLAEVSDRPGWLARVRQP